MLLVNRHVSLGKYTCFIFQFPHTRPNSHYKAQSYKKKKTNQKKHTGELFRKRPKIEGAYINSRLKAICQIIRQRKTFEVFHSLGILEKKPLKSYNHTIYENNKQNSSRKRKQNQSFIKLYVFSKNAHTLHSSLIIAKISKFYFPRNHQKIKGFLIISGVMVRGQGSFIQYVRKIL